MPVCSEHRYKEDTHVQPVHSSPQPTIHPHIHATMQFTTILAIAVYASLILAFATPVPQLAGTHESALAMRADDADDAGVRSGNTTINGTIIGGNGNSGNNSSNGGSNIGSNGGNGGNNANSGNITGGNGNQGNSGNSGSVGGGVIIGGNVAGNGGNRGDKRSAAEIGPSSRIDVHIPRQHPSETSLRGLSTPTSLTSWNEVQCISQWLNLLVVVKSVYGHFLRGQRKFGPSVASSSPFPIVIQAHARAGPPPWRRSCCLWRSLTGSRGSQVQCLKISGFTPSLPPLHLPDVNANSNPAIYLPPSSRTALPSSEDDSARAGTKGA
ncbi:hypothetical protein AB1N83_012531 [Pleurotus pulmonarius]